MKNSVILIFLFLSSYCISQIHYENHINPFPQRDVYIVDSEMGVDQDNIYCVGYMYNIPTMSGLPTSFILRRKDANNSLYKFYYANTFTRINSIVINSRLKNYYAFQYTDIDVGCLSGGLKILKLDKNNLNVVDSVFYCNITHPGPPMGYYMYGQFFILDHHISYYPTLPVTYTKVRTTLNRVDTNLVLKNSKKISDTAVNFYTKFLRQGCDDGIILNTYNDAQRCPMLIKVDTSFNEIWRKNYYTGSANVNSWAGLYSGADDGIKGLQSYKDGYIALFNMDITSSYYYFSIIAKLDKFGNLLKEVQYTSAGDTTLELYSNMTEPAFRPRTYFMDVLIKTNDGNFASVISEKEKYGWATPKNYIVVLDTNLNIIHRSPPLGHILDSISNVNLVQGMDNTFYLTGGIVNPARNGMNIRIYSYKIGGDIVEENLTDEVDDFYIYPNPATDKLLIKGSESFNKVQLVSMTGQVLLSEKVINKPHQMNLSVASGVYIVIILQDDKILRRRKIVVNK